MNNLNDYLLTPQLVGCSVFDQAVPGTGPPGLVSAKAPNVETAKYNDSFNLSLKSRSDFNLNPSPEGFVKTAFPKFEKTREGIYAIETDRGELSATYETQINVKGQRQFQNRLQDTVKPTTKETTLYTYDGVIAPITQAPSEYSTFIPYYAKIDGKNVRINGASNYGLRSATNFSYIPGAAPTGINGQAIQNPDVVASNVWKRPDFNVDGPGTFKGVIPDAGKYQNYRVITAPTTNGLRLNYNLETDGGSVADYSQLLGKQVDGIENRYTASYQIAPLFTNPLHVIWDPDNKGEIPAFYTNQNPADYSSMNFKSLPKNEEFTPGGYNTVWAPDTTKNSTNAYILDMDTGVYNPRINWRQGPNDRPGTIYEDSVKALPGASYSANRSIDDLFNHDQESINKAYPFVNMRPAFYGQPDAGQIAT
jgi:hypothetical protein